MTAAIDQAKVQRIREAFRDDDLSFAEWARSRGFNPSLVYEVLAGRRRAMRGETREIAVALGLKRPRRQVKRR